MPNINNTFFSRQSGPWLKNVRNHQGQLCRVSKVWFWVGVNFLTEKNIFFFWLSKLTHTEITLIKKSAAFSIRVKFSGYKFYFFQSEVQDQLYRIKKCRFQSGSSFSNEKNIFFHWAKLTRSEITLNKVQRYFQ